MEAKRAILATGAQGAGWWSEGDYYTHKMTMQRLNRLVIMFSSEALMPPSPAETTLAVDRILLHLLLQLVLIWQL